MFDLKGKVLIIDDMMTMRKLVAKSLKEIGFTNLTEAADGALGWEALNNSEMPVTLIISDWNMPNCTGLDLLKRVRADSRYKTLPFILLTAETEAKQVSEALQNGVSGYVLKPFTVEALKTKIEAVHKKMAA